MKAHQNRFNKKQTQPQIFPERKSHFSLYTPPQQHKQKCKNTKWCRPYLFSFFTPKICSFPFFPYIFLFIYTCNTLNPSTKSPPQIKFRKIQGKQLRETITLALVVIQVTILVGQAFELTDYLVTLLEIE